MQLCLEAAINLHVKVPFLKDCLSWSHLGLIGSFPRSIRPSQDTATRPKTSAWTAKPIMLNALGLHLWKRKEEVPIMTAMGLTSVTDIPRNISARILLSALSESGLVA